MANQAQQHRRYWRRVETPVLPWWPWALGPLIGLLALFLYGALGTAPAMESATREAVAAQISQLPGANSTVEASGQAINIVTNATNTAPLVAMAQGARCDTWVGPLNCPTTVAVSNGQTTTQAAPQATAQRTPADSVSPDTASSRHHDLVLTRVGQRVVLRGEVPSEERRASLLAAARAQFNTVDDELQITGRPARQADLFASRSALELLADLQRGQVIWAQGVMSSSGLVAANKESALRARFAELGNTIRTDGLNLRVTQPLAACDEAFAKALRESTIAFATGAATIDSNSTALLERLAALAKQCPGELVIEGHTDNIGRPRLNRQLSLARAEAVRDALISMGVAAGRLSAKGLGAGQPIADNNSREGRARNRRIVIRGAQG